MSFRHALSSSARGPARTSAAAAALAAVLAAALAACSSVSLDNPPPVRTVVVPPVRPAASAPAGPASAASRFAPLPSTAPATPPVAVTSPVAPPPTLQTGPLDGEPPGPPLESAGVAARFPDPLVSYRTPAFESNRTAFTSTAEIQALLRGLVREGNGGANSTTIRLVPLGSSQSGVPLDALLFTRDGAVPGKTTRPTVMLVGQQHGDEPAGSEALLAVAQELAQGKLQPLLDRINVVLLPRVNPDGANAGKRVSASGIDINRDHLLLRTPEAQAVAQLAREFDPAVVVDAHEYSVLGRFVEKFGAVQRYDVLTQYAMTANLPDFISKASEEWFRRPLLQALKTEELSAEWYYTTSSDPTDKKISMGGVQPDTGRNVYGLRNAVSVLVETRGIGLGRAHFLRRVHSHVVAITSILSSAANRSADILKLRQYVAAEVAAKACQGELVVEAAATPSEYTLTMLDPQTGADRKVSVAWDSALQLTPVTRRPRPCGYWLRSDQIDAVLRLRSLGVQVFRADEAGAVRGETYRELARESVVRADVRGSVADAGDTLKVKVELVPALVDVPAGSYYVGLDQPLANLAAAALEPDSQNSYLAHRIVGALDGQARVLQRPELKLSPVP